MNAKRAATQRAVNLDNGQYAPMKKRLLHVSLGLASTAVLAALVLRMVNLAAVGAALSAADIRLIPAAMAVHVLAMWVRTLVWRRLLPSRPPTRTLFKVSIIGFAINYLMPVRVGELVRVYLARCWTKDDSGAILASLVVERVLDGIAVSAILLSALLFLPAPGYVLAFGLAISAVFAGLAVVLGLASWRIHIVLRIAELSSRVLPRRVRPAFMRLAQGFATSMRQVRDLRSLPVLLGLAVCGWLCQFAVFYLMLLAFPVEPSLPMALVGGSVANFATLLPSGPGAVGAFDASLIKLLVDIQHVSAEVATAYALVVHMVVVIPIVVLGAVSMWRADLSLGQLLRFASPQPTPSRLNQDSTHAERRRVRPEPTIASSFIGAPNAVASPGESWTG